MAVYSAKRDPNRCPTHPGELLGEVIPATGKSKTVIAALLGISRQHLYDILAQRKPVSPPSPSGSASCSGTGQGFGCVCRAPTILGTPSASLPTRSGRYPG